VLFGHPTIAETPYAGCSYVARIDFEYGPRAYKAGDEFDPQALGLNESQARDLWVAGRLLVKPRVEAPISVPVARVAGTGKR
jgi:hypothetical protein